MPLVLSWLGVSRSIYPACQMFSDELLECLSVWSKVQMVIGCMAAVTKFDRHRTDTFKQLPQNMSQLIMSTRLSAVPSLVKIHLWGEGFG